MNKHNLLNNLKDQENTVADNGIANLDDDMLQSVSGGCTSTCGATTRLFSCVPPGDGCP